METKTSFLASTQGEWAIPDNTPEGVIVPLQMDVKVVIESIKVHVVIEHPFIGDLRVNLNAPSGKSVTLHNRVGFANDNIEKTFEGDVLNTFIGEEINGEWQLQAIDFATRDNGFIKSWSLEANCAIVHTTTPQITQEQEEMTVVAETVEAIAETTDAPVVVEAVETEEAVVETIETPVVAETVETEEAVVETIEAPVVAETVETVEAVVETIETPVVAETVETEEVAVETIETPVVAETVEMEEVAVETIETPVVAETDETVEAVVETIETPVVAETIETVEAVIETTETPIAIADETDETMDETITPDDLKKIEGIGPKIEELLNNAGVFTFAQLAEMETEDIQDILDAAGPAYNRHDPETWAEQAELAANEEWDELKTWQDELVGGKVVEN
jgi:subtilisin-like proprotein convertase family protein